MITGPVPFSSWREGLVVGLLVVGLGHLAGRTAGNAATAPVVVGRHETPGRGADDNGGADEGYDEVRETFHGMGMLAHIDSP